MAALDDFLKQGGGVVIFGGDQVVAENYNRLLYDDGNGLLPAEIGPSVGDAAKKEAGFFFNPLGYRHPLVAAYQGEAEPVTAGLTQALTWQYHKLVIPKGSKAEVALAFDTGDPGRRRSASPPRDGDPGGDLGRHRLDDLADPQELPAGHAADRPAGLGRPALGAEHSRRPAVRPVVSGGRGVGRRSRWSRPGSSRSPTKLQPAGGVSQFHFEQTDLSGAYQVKIGPPLALDTSFAANTDPAESDLTKLDRAALAEILPGWNFLVSDELERVDRGCKLGRPPRRAAPPLALRPLDPALGRIDSGVEIRAP